MSSPTFVIVGAGLAGAKAAETLRAEGFGGRLLLFGDEGERPYDRPPPARLADPTFPLDQVAGQQSGATTAGSIR